MNIYDEIRRLVLEMARRGASTDEINESVAILLERAGFDSGEYYQMQQEAQRLWIASRALPEEELAVARKMLAATANQYARIGGEIRRDVTAIVSEALREDVRTGELESRLIARLRLREDWAKTITRTSRLTFNTANTIGKAAEAGIKRYRYSGPATRRPFCQLHLGMTYGIGEIKRMDNGQGLPALYYRGGYNCRHRWVPVVE